MDKQKRSIVRIDPSSKIVLSFVVAFVWFLVTNGRPPNRNLLEGLSHTETTRQSIFQIAIAVEKKLFTKRIIEQSQGYWSYIPYANQPRWIDLEIRLTTKIGFDLKNGDNFNFGTTPEGKNFIEVFEPTVIEKHWTTQVIDTSDNIFNKWDIRQYKNKEEQIIAAIAEAQSEQMLEDFKNDPGKMGQLAHLLDNKLAYKQSIFSYPLKWLDHLNYLIENKIRQFKHSIFRADFQPEVWNSAHYNKQSSYVKKKSQGIKGDKANSANLKGRPQKQLKSIGYSAQQKRVRQQMRTKSNQ